MRLPRVVAIYSPVMQSGKSHIAKWLVREKGFVRLPFALLLKQMCRPLFESLGYSPSEIELFENGDKSQTVEGRTIRHFYQTLGTEWGRKLIHEDLWVHAWRKRAETILAMRDVAGVVADDCRFPNELRVARREMGGQLWEVQRPGQAELTGHSSEGQLNGLCDFLAINDGTLADLDRRLMLAWSN